MLLVSQIVSLGSLCGWGGLGLIIMSILNLSWVKLMLGWVVTIRSLSFLRVTSRLTGLTFQIRVSFPLTGLQCYAFNMNCAVSKLFERGRELNLVLRWCQVISVTSSPDS